MTFMYIDFVYFLLIGFELADQLTKVVCCAGGMTNMKAVLIVLCLGLVGGAQESSAKDPNPDYIQLLLNANQTQTTINTDNNGRISQYLLPINYNITLQPFINGNLSISGHVQLTFTVVTSTDKIILNMADIITQNDTCQVTALDGTEAPIILDQTYQQYYQQYIVHLDRNLTEGLNYKIALNFIGVLNTKLVGFYLSTYKNAAGDTKRLAATQFSPTDARKAFPCLDEPFFKATFDITLLRQANMTTWSNMPLKKSIAIANGSDWIADTFNRTPIMSTYLVGFLISDFTQQTSNASDHIAFSVITRNEAASQTDYAASFGLQTLVFLEQYFDIAFPLPKLDMAAIPDFKFNGMENWGLIMYRETAMLYDEVATTIDGKRKIAQVISHEIAHQWFGNLVTPHWWSDLWLKEGFANFMGYMAADAVDGSWGMMDYLMYGTMRSALELDSFHSSHPINVQVDHADRISEIFDSISYNKGASIIRMMFHFLGENNYKRGMTNYLNTLAYKNANQDQLWDFLTQAWTQPNTTTQLPTVKQVMDTWTLQEGYPIINVTRSHSSIVFEQDRFLMEGKVYCENCTEATWWVPLSYTYQSEPNFNLTQPLHWMKPSDKQLQIQAAIGTEEWLVVNVQRSAFYRVNYEPHNWQLLAMQLQTQPQHIHPLNRAQLLDDSFNLARAGMIPYDIALNLTLYLKTEHEVPAWQTFLDNFKYIYNQAKYSQSNQSTIIKKYVLGLIVPLYNTVGYEERPNDTHDTQTLRSKAVWWACHLGHAPCVQKARVSFEKWLRDPSLQTLKSIKNIKSIVLCTGVKEGTESTWNETFQRYQQSNIQTEQIDILTSLACTRDKNILQRFLAMSLQAGSPIKKQDSANVFKAVSSTKMGREIAWALLKEQWSFVIQYLGSGSPLIWRILEAPTLTFGSEQLLNELEAFQIATKDTIGSAKQILERSIEGAKLNVAWKKSLFADILAWLSLQTTTLI